MSVHMVLGSEDLQNIGEGAQIRVILLNPHLGAVRGDVPANVRTSPDPWTGEFPTEPEAKVSDIGIWGRGR